MTKLPPIGLVVTYKRGELSSDFTVTNVDVNTGRIDLLPHDLEGARVALTITVKNKHNEDTQTFDFAWVKETQSFAVNVEWDAWTKHVQEWTP